MTPQGMHALVTGGTRGIGAAIAGRLCAEGYRVTVVSRNIDTWQASAAGLPQEIQAVAADVADAAQVRAAFELAIKKYGDVQLLVNCAGLAPSAKFLKTDEETWRRTLDVNLMGSVNCIQAVLPTMLESGWGRVVNVASTAGLVGYAYVSAYCASKHAVVGLTRSLALEVAQGGITVNAVCPGYTDTDIMRQSISRIVSRTGRSQEEARAVFEKTNPQGRLVKPEEVADVVAWLCGSGASAITGQAISVSGGEVG